MPAPTMRTWGGLDDMFKFGMSRWPFVFALLGLVHVLGLWCLSRYAIKACLLRDANEGLFMCMDTYIYTYIHTSYVHRYLGIGIWDEQTRPTGLFHSSYGLCFLFR
jgi:hypothetical protein